MNKLTKLLSVFIIAGAVGASVAGVSGCKKKNKGTAHTHNYTWVDDNNGKCHEHCGVDGCNEPDKAAQDHVWGNDNTCDNCGATKSDDNNPGGDDDNTPGGGDDNNPGGDDDNTPGGDDNNPGGDDDNTPGGEVTTKPVYETLKERADKLTVLDDNYAEGDKLSAYTNDIIKGIYFRYQTGNSVGATDPERDYIDVVKDGDDLALQQHGSNGATAGLPNVFTEIVVGPVSNKLEGYFETKMNKLANSGQTPIVFYNNGSSVLSIKETGGSLSYKLGSGEDVAISGAKMAADTYIKVHFVFDFESGKTTLKIDDTVVLDEVETGITYMDRIELASSNKGDRQHTTRKIVVCGAAMTAEEYRPIALANLDKEYAKYTFEDSADGTVKATHSINADKVIAAYEDGKAAINAATTLADIQKEYSAVVKTMGLILSDEGVAAARAAAIALVDERYPAADYTFEGLTGEDEIYNNKVQYEEIYNNVVETINTHTTAEGLNNYIQFTVLSSGNSPFNVVQANDWMISDKMDAVNEILSTYGDEEIAKLDTTKDGVPEIIALIRELQENGVGRSYSDGGIIELFTIVEDEEHDDDVYLYATIDDVNKAFEEVKEEIDSLLLATTETLEQTIARLQSELEEHGEAEKEGLTDQTKIAAIDEAVNAGKNAIAKAESATDATVIYEEEVVKVSIAADKIDAKAELDAEAAKCVIVGESLEATTATQKIAAAVSDGKSAIDGATTHAELSQALNSAVTAIETAYDELLATKFNIQVLKADGSVLIETKLIYGSTLAVDENSADITDSEKIDKYYSENTEGVLSGELTLSEIKVYGDITIYASITEAKRIQQSNAFSYSAINSSGFGTRPYADKTAGDNVYLDNNDFKGTVNEFLTINNVVYDGETISSSPVTWRKSNSAIQNVGAGLSFTVGGAATISITFCSTGSTNESRIGLQGADGKYIAAKSFDSAISLITTVDVKPATETTDEQTFDNIGAYKITGATGKVITFAVTEAGTYAIVCPNDYTGRGARITAISVQEDYRADLDVSVTWGSQTVKYYHADAITAPKPTDLGETEKFDYWYYMDGETEVRWEDGSTLPAGNYTFIAKISQAAAVASIEMSASAAEIEIGGSVTLTATPKDAEGNELEGRAVTWSVGAYEFAEISADGTLTLKDGAEVGDEITVTATIGSITETVTLTVTEAKAVADAIDMSKDTNTSSHAINLTSEGGYFTVTSTGGNFSYSNSTGLGACLLAGGSKRSIIVTAKDNVQSVTVTLVYTIAGDSGCTKSGTGVITNPDGTTENLTTSVVNGVTEIKQHTVTLTAGQTLTVASTSNRVVLIGATASVVPKA